MDGFIFKNMKLEVDFKKTKKKNQNNNRPNDQDICYNCSKKGHWFTINFYLQG